MATDKRKVSVYLEDTLKVEAERLAKSRKRSLNNLIEVLLEEAVTAAKQSGEVAAND